MGTYVPISRSLLNLIKIRKLDKSTLISQGDDYQILFTASPIKARIIHHTSKNFGMIRWNWDTRKIALQIYNIDGRILYEKTLKIQ